MYAMENPRLLRLLMEICKTVQLMGNFAITKQFIYSAGAINDYEAITLKNHRRRSFQLFRFHITYSPWIIAQIIAMLKVVKSNGIGLWPIKLFLWAQLWQMTTILLCRLLYIFNVIKIR